MIRDEIIKELQHIPENKLLELYDLIHYFRLGLMVEAVKKTENNLKIEPQICLETLEKIKHSDFSSFSEIKDIDAHIQSLKNEVS